MFMKYINNSTKNMKSILFIIKSLGYEKNNFFFNATKFTNIKHFLRNSVKSGLTNFNLVLIRYPLLFPIFFSVIVFVLNMSVAHCVTYDDVYSSSNKAISSSEQPGLFQAAKASRSQCPSNFNDQILPPNFGTPFKDVSVLYPNYTNPFPIQTTTTLDKLPFPHSIYTQESGLLQAAVTNRNTCYSNFLDQEPQNNNNQIFNSKIDVDDNMLAMSIADQLFYEMLEAQDNHPEKELKFLVHEYISNHNTKETWGLSVGGTIEKGNIAGKIIGYNCSNICDSTQQISANEKIIRAHINVQIFLQNLSVTKNVLIPVLLNNEPLYDDLLQKQFPPK